MNNKNYSIKVYLFVHKNLTESERLKQCLLANIDIRKLEWCDQPIIKPVVMAHGGRIC